MFETKEADFFFRTSTHVKTLAKDTRHNCFHPSTNAEKETRYIQYGQLLLKILCER